MELRTLSDLLRETKLSWTSLRSAPQTQVGCAENSCRFSEIKQFPERCELNARRREGRCGPPWMAASRTGTYALLLEPGLEEQSQVSRVFIRVLSRLGRSSEVSNSSRLKLNSSNSCRPLHRRKNEMSVLVSATTVGSFRNHLNLQCMVDSTSKELQIGFLAVTCP